MKNGKGKNAINFGSKLQLSIKNSNLKKINMRNKTKKFKYSKKLWSTIKVIGKCKCLDKEFDQ